MKNSDFFVLVAAWLVFAAAGHAVTIDTVPIGNPGNPADMRWYFDPFQSNGVGSVGYDFRIGKYEVTNVQYTEFLNGVDPTGANSLALYNSSMASDAPGGILQNLAAAAGSKYSVKPGRGNNPVAYISWYDAIRFANWLHNGQGAGDTETGAYTLLGGTPTPSNGNSITRNAGATWWLPSENEWYKAAYHKNDGMTGNYWDYPFSTDAVPYSDQPPGNDSPDPSRTGNFFANDDIANGYNDGYAATGALFDSTQNYLTDIGAYASAVGPYGTFDQGGNAREWNDTLSDIPRTLRGGAWFGGGLHASQWSAADPATPFVAFDIGFRVATTVPEPSAVCLGSIAVICIAWRRRRCETPQRESPREILRQAKENFLISTGCAVAADFLSWQQALARSLAEVRCFFNTTHLNCQPILENVIMLRVPFFNTWCDGMHPNMPEESHMNCSLCNRPAPGNVETMIDAGWIPSYFSGQQQMPGPVCPDCCKKHLRIGKDGEWETVAAPADAYRWN